MNIRQVASACLTMLMLTSCDGGSADDPSTEHALEQRESADASQPQTSSPNAGTTQQLRVGEMVFDVLTAGPADGQLVLLLHGFPQNAHEWDAQISALAAEGYRVVAPNQRGYSRGARPARAAAYATSELVKDVLGMADALGAQRFHLVGHDWGAIVAWSTAAAAPERIQTLTTVSVPHPAAFAEAMTDPSGCQVRASSYVGLYVTPFAEGALLANDAARLRNVYSDLPREKIETYIRFFDRPTLTGALNWYRSAQGGRPVGSITVPTMYVWSDRDKALCRYGAERTRNFVTGPYRFEVIEGVSHWVPENAAERLNGLLRDHLKTARPQP